MLNNNTGLGAADTYVDLPDGIISVLTNASFEFWVTTYNSEYWARIFDFGSLPGPPAPPGIFFGRGGRLDWVSGFVEVGGLKREQPGLMSRSSIIRQSGRPKSM